MTSIADGRSIRSSAVSTSLPWSIIIACVVARAILPPLTVNTWWEFHRDELLYLAMGEHLSWFTMQFPPLTAVVAALARSAFGDSPMAMRVGASLAGAALLGVMLLAIRRLGGGKWAALLTLLASLAAPVFVRTSLMLQPVILDILFATITFAALTFAAHEDDARWWWLVGIGLGLGALTKFSVAFVGVAVIVATLTTAPLRRQLAGPTPWLALLLAAVLSVPSLAGQFAHGWPFLDQMRVLRSAQLDRVSPSMFVVGQLMMLAGATVPVLAGAVTVRRGGPVARVPFVTALTLIALMLLLHGKEYYAAPGYPMLIVTGAVALERWLATRAAWRNALVLAMSGTAVMLWPLGVPTLPPSSLIRYAARFGAAAPVRTNTGETLALPQDFADMLGWRALADSVGAAAGRLPAADRADLTVVTANYGQAGALALHHRRVGIPYPITPASDFWAWGTGTASGDIVLAVGPEAMEPQLRRLYRDVRIVGRTNNPFGVPEEQAVLIFIARGARVPLRDAWKTLGPRWG